MTFPFWSVAHVVHHSSPLLVFKESQMLWRRVGREVSGTLATRIRAADLLLHLSPPGCINGSTGGCLAPSKSTGTTSCSFTNRICQLAWLTWKWMLPWWYWWHARCSTRGSNAGASRQTASHGSVDISLL